MKYTLDYEADGGGLETPGQVIDRLGQIIEELAAFCEGDVSHNRLERVAIDLSVGLVSLDDFAPGCSELCYEPYGKDAYSLPLERSEHGRGCDLADVLGLLEDFVRRVEWLCGLCAFGPLSRPAEVRVALTMATIDPRLAGKLGFAPVRKAA